MTNGVFASVAHDLDNIAICFSSHIPLFKHLSKNFQFRKILYRAPLLRLILGHIHGLLLNQSNVPGVSQKGHFKEL